jgi:uncharacterized membrane protein YkvA (DUF1232 family)
MEASLQRCPAQTRPPFAETLKASLSRFVQQQARIIRSDLGHPHVPWYAKVVSGCVVGFVFSPVQLIPSFIPIVGQLETTFSCLDWG